MSLVLKGKAGYNEDATARSGAGAECVVATLLYLDPHTRPRSRPERRANLAEDLNWNLIENAFGTGIQPQTLNNRALMVTQLLRLGVERDKT